MYREWAMLFGASGGFHEEVERDFFRQLYVARTLLKKVASFRIIRVDEEEYIKKPLIFRIRNTFMI